VLAGGMVLSAWLVHRVDEPAYTEGKK
jgi:hypothetical protein